MRFRLKTDTKGYEIDRNARSIASLDSENDAFLTASSEHTLTNKKLSYDQLTSVPIRAPANWNETDESQMKQNFMRLTFHVPILKLTKTTQNHNKEHIELKSKMKEVSNENFCSF